ncbi:MAG: efflux RND transporter periplasmic adaptor subunit [Pseudomonadota bacterium]
MQLSRTLLAGASIGALVASSIWYAADRLDLPSLVAEANAAAPIAAAPAPTVDVIAAQTQSIVEWDEFAGRFQAVDEVAIRARVSGHLDAVHFDPGQIVEKGDLLFTIDPRPFEAALAEARAQLEEARAAAQLAESEFGRAQQLYERGHVSTSVLDTRAQGATAAEAAISAAVAVVERAELDLAFTKITSPVTGRISDDAVSPGNLIAAGAASGALTTIVSINPIHFVFDATEQQYLEYMRATGGESLRSRASQTPVAVRLIDEPDFAHQGAIDFVDNRIDRATGTIRGRAVLENADGVLTPGMFGRLRLATAENVERVLISERAIGSDQNTKFVWVMREDDTVTRRLVTLGDQHGDLRIVLSGIDAGDRVVVGGLHMLGEGAHVTARFIDEDPVRVAAR